MPRSIAWPRNASCWDEDWKTGAATVGDTLGAVAAGAVAVLGGGGPKSETSSGGGADGVAGGAEASATASAIAAIVNANRAADFRAKAVTGLSDMWPPPCSGALAAREGDA